MEEQNIVVVEEKKGINKKKALKIGGGLLALVLGVIGVGAAVKHFRKGDSCECYEAECSEEE